MKRWLLIMGLGLSVLLAVQAQTADTTLAQWTPLATFVDARAVAVDPSGAIYVVDAGRDAVVKLDANGAVVATLGGPGLGANSFDGPADVDPTNGLVLLVADAGNGRLQQFSRQFALLASLRLVDVDAALGQDAVVYSGVDQEAAGAPAGAPVAVASSPSNETFAVDALQGVVFKWDRNRRLERVIGTVDDGDGVLVEPVALAVDRQTLYVVDPGQSAVQVYDTFGGYVRTLQPQGGASLRSIFLAPNAVWLVMPDRLVHYNTRGRQEGSLDLALEAPVVDAAWHQGQLFALTSMTLYRTSFSP